ncbi:elements of external origin [Magnetococcus sp. PR-3]|uniref:elements of external origin n=1 Tax=Magnetococcus sp. PR-3 TaxID=3120355 RepID=UPI002FCDEFED
MQKLSSNSALARAIGVSEGAVRKAEKTGRISRDADGVWDLEEVSKQWKQNSDPAKKRGTPKSNLKPVPVSAQQVVNDTLAQQSASPSGGPPSYAQAKTADMALRAQLRKIELEEKKRSLIDREKVLSHVFKNARQFRDAWQNWPSRVASRMAAELGVDDHQMHLCLERYVREHLEEISDQNFSLE